MLIKNFFILSFSFIVIYAANKPSWCYLAKTYVENKICNNSKFWALDEELVSIYNLALLEINDEKKYRLKKTERLWWKLRNSECYNKSDECIIKHYKDRISIIKTNYLGYTKSNDSNLVDIKPVKPKVTEPVPVPTPVKPKVTTGTGFFISNKYLITNYHVIKNCNYIKIQRLGYRTSATIIAKDINNDLSILKANAKNIYNLKLRNSRVKIGEDVITLGYPLGEKLGENVKLTTGVISALNGLYNDSTKYQFTAPTQYGNSGGPLIDRYGSVIGVIYAGLKNTQNVNLAIKVNTVKQFLEANDIDYENSSNTEKKDISDIADEAKKAIVQVICK